MVLGFAVTAGAAAQAQRGSSRGFGMGMRGSNLLGLLRIEQVQQDLKLSEEEVGKITELGQKVRAEMREKFSALREIDDQGQRRAKMAELVSASNEKVREQLRDVLSREQLRRLFQIRMQVQPLVDTLTSQWIGRRLELTEQQRQKLAAIVKEGQEKLTELRAGMRSFRDATQEQRAELFQKFRKIRTEADEKGLELLTAEQKDALEKMKGAKIELPPRRRRQR